VLHRKAALATDLSGKRLNQWAEEMLDRAAGEPAAVFDFTLLSGNGRCRFRV